ncbi:MAG: hypothetical protein RI885_2430 [Actinomycetota bacterium]
MTGRGRGDAAPLVVPSVGAFGSGDVRLDTDGPELES